MKKISMIIHRWLGLALSLWLLLITFTGTVLLFKNDLLELWYPQLEQSSAASQEQALSVLDSDQALYSFLPSEHHPWIEMIDEKGARNYFSHQGELLLSRSQYGDWISWFAEFHHHLLLDDLGNELQGIFGLLAMLVFFTGVIKWWPKSRIKKRDISVTLSRPGKKKWGQTLWQSHRTLGVVLFLPMFLFILTGVGMIYYSAFNVGLNFLFPQESEQKIAYDTVLKQQNIDSENLDGSWATRIAQVKAVMPDAQPIMIYNQRDKFRLKQPEEWHPNGRSYMTFHEGTSKIKTITNYRNETLGMQLSQKVYPLHIAAVGGTTYLSIAVASGIALIWICISGVWFWLWWRNKKKASLSKKTA